MFRSFTVTNDAGQDFLIPNLGTRKCSKPQRGVLTPAQGNALGKCSLNSEP